MPSTVERNIAESKRIKEESALESEARKKINEHLIKQKKNLIDNFIDSTVFGLFLCLLVSLAQVEQLPRSYLQASMKFSLHTLNLDCASNFQ